MLQGPQIYLSIYYFKETCVIYLSFQNFLFTCLWQGNIASAEVRLRTQCALKQGVPFSGEQGNTNCYFKIILMPWKEPFAGVLLRKEFLAKVLEMHICRNSFLSKVKSCWFCSFVLQPLGLALFLILMFIFASVAINVLPIAGLVHSVIAQPNLSQCSFHVPPKNIKRPLVF